MSNRILMVFFFIIMLVNMQVSYAGSEEEAIEFHLVSTSSVLVSPPSLSDSAASDSKLVVSDKERIIVLKVKNINTIGNVKIIGVSSEPGNEIFTVDSDDFFNLYKCKGELKPGESCLVRARISVKDKIDENKLLPLTISYSLGEKTYDVTSEVSLRPNTSIVFHLVSTSSVLVSPPSLSDSAASDSKLVVSDKERIIVLKVKNINTIGNVKIIGVSSEPGNEIFTVDSDDFFNLYKCKGELKPGESCLVRARISVKDKIDENKLLPLTISYSLGEKTYDVTSEVSLRPNTSIVLDQQVNSGSKLNELDFSKESPKFFLKNVSGSVLDIKNISIESGVATAECEDSLSNFQADGTLKVTMPLTRSEYFLRFFNKKIDDDYIVVSYSEVGKDEVKEVYIPIVTTLQYSKSAWGIAVAAPIVVVATATAIVCVTLHCGVVTALGYVGYYGAVWPIKSLGYYGIVCPLKYGLYYPIKWIFGYGYGPGAPAGGAAAGGAVVGGGAAGAAAGGVGAGLGAGAAGGAAGAAAGGVGAGLGAGAAGGAAGAAAGGVGAGLGAGAGAAVFAMPAVVNTVNVGIALRVVGATYDRGRWYDAAGGLINPASAIGMIMSAAGVIYNGGRWYVGAVARVNLVN